MSTHSVAEAKNGLSDLINRALKGEDVVITRHGRPVVTLTPVAAADRPISQDEIDWIVRHRVGSTPGAVDAGTLVSAMRDEDWR